MTKTKITIVKVLLVTSLFFLYLCGFLMYYMIRKNEIIKMGQSATEYLEDAILVTNRKNRIVYANKAFLDMVGYSYDEIHNEKPSFFKSGYHNKDFYIKMWAEIRETGYWKGEVIDRKKDGSIFIKDTKIIAFFNKQGKINKYVSIQKNVDYIKKLEIDNDKYQYYSTETLLPNERFFIKNLDVFIKDSTVDHKVVYCRIMNQLPIESKFGHKTYLDALILFSNKVKNIIGENTLVAELGNSSLAFVITNCQNKDEIIINKIISAAQVLKISDKEITFDVRLGIAIYDSEYNNSARKLLSKSFIAVNKVIETKDQIYMYYNESLEKRFYDELEMQEELRKAVKNKLFNLNYQPQINSETKEIIGVEALIRWHNEKLGTIPPNIFLKVAEKYGYMNKIDEFVLETAFNDYERIQAISSNTKISINVSQQELSNEKFYFSLKAKLKQYNFEPTNLVVELTEGQEIIDITRLVEYTRSLKELGVEISLDDFGTGYNSLSTLALIPSDEIKIDKSFIDKYLDETISIVQAVVALAHNMKKRVIAEGVEQYEQVKVLNEIGCYNIQGYYYAKPMPLERLLEFMKENLDD
ncbi:sensor domain-containing protein [Haploplasma axanthum]|nr:EAL domain-containing protein [Haploplasma axanthum]